MSIEEKKHKVFGLWIFAISFIVFSFIASFNYVVDPFKMNDKFDLGLPRDVVSFVANSQLLRVIEYKKHPVKNIITGDSRGNSFQRDIVSKIAGEPVFNLSFPGGTIYESLEAIDLAMETTDLQSIFMVVSFDFFGNIEKRDTVSQARFLSSNPVAYYTSLFVTRISLRNIITAAKHEDLTKLNRPDATKENYWNFMLTSKMESMFRNTAFREETTQRLKTLKEKCNEGGIRLVFIIPPAHTDFQDAIPRFGLTDDYNKFKQTLAEISETVDFDYVNKWTTDKSIYGDPIHFHQDVMEEIFSEVWNQKYRIGIRLDTGKNK